MTLSPLDLNLNLNLNPACDSFRPLCLHLNFNGEIQELSTPKSVSSSRKRKNGGFFWMLRDPCAFNVVGITFKG